MSTTYTIKDTISGEMVRGLNTDGVEDWLRDMFGGHFPDVENSAWDLVIALKAGDWEMVHELCAFLGVWVTRDVG